jgi:4-hydroxybutyrate CoA-transferase
MTKWIDSETVAGLLRPGMTVFVAGATAEPKEILEGLARQGQHCAGVRFVCVSIPGLNQVDFSTLHPETDSTVFLSTPGNRESVASGRVDFLPLHYSAIFNYLERHTKIDVAILQLPPAGSDGYSYGISTDFAPAVVQRADLVIGEINQQQPIPVDALRIPNDELDYIVACNRPVPTMPTATIDETALEISHHVSQLIMDGDCIQIGIGAVPSATLTALSAKNDLGFHSGMISDGVMALAESGNITGNNKTLDPGKIVSGVTLGSQPLIDWAGMAPELAIRPVSYTHDCDVIRKIDNFVSVNSALQVDLFGQVNSDMLKGHQVSGTGGAVDMMRGATLSNGGKSIIALAATAAGGSTSRIVPALSAQTAATALRTDVDYVVTEYGARQIRYLPVQARAKALIEIAHPDFRDRLRDQWNGLR